MDIDTEIDIQINQLQAGVGNISLELDIDRVQQVHTSSNHGDARIYSCLNNVGAYAFDENGQNQNQNNYFTRSLLDENTNCIDPTNSTGVKMSFDNNAEFAEEHNTGPLVCSSRPIQPDEYTCQPLQKRSFKDKSTSSTLGSISLKTITKNILKTTTIIDKKMKSARSTATEKCLFCGECFDSVRSRLKHANEMHDPKPFLCIICGKRFLFESTLSIHRGSTHC